MIYIFILAVVVPLFVNMILNLIIFIHVRRSSHRIIQPQSNNNEQQTSGINTRPQQPKISRRDISLLKNMIFIFTMFILGWTPIFVINIVDFLNSVRFVIVMSCVYLSAVCVLAIIIHLFLCNREIRVYLFDLIRNIC